MSQPTVENAPTWLREHSSRIVAAAAIVALLYVGRDVLIPLALAILLSLLLAPLVRALRRIGVGRITSVLIVVLVLAVACVAAAAVLGREVLRIAEGLPQYEANVHHKLVVLDDLATTRIRILTRETEHLLDIESDGAAARDSGLGDSTPLPTVRPGSPLAADPSLASQPLLIIGKLLRAVWPPIQGILVVLIVLIFVLLEHESLRDRLIRVAGLTDIHATTVALHDASERLSRYFVSQFTVNAIFGTTVWIFLSLLGVPAALLCGGLAALMRFAPYLGIALAALFATALAFAVDPGWAMAVETLGIFIVLDVLTGQWIEPRLYGHATGLSPLSVIVAALFWSALWGPAGLILSTPLTLCLLVAGRHVRALRFIELLLGDVQPLTLAQKLYQRALSGDPYEIIADARAFLRRNSLAVYCDRVILPALHLARLDRERGSTTDEQNLAVRRVLIEVVSALTSARLGLPHSRPRGSVLEVSSAGAWLREQRERASGPWQGPLGVPAGSVVLCLAMGSAYDELAAELLVRLLRTDAVDARHFSWKDVDRGLPPGADPDGVSLVYVVSAFPGQQHEGSDLLDAKIRKILPLASVIRVLCRGAGLGTDSAAPEYGAANSLAEAVRLCLPQRTGRHPVASTGGSKPLTPA